MLPLFLIAAVFAVAGCLGLPFLLRCCMLRAVSAAPAAPAPNRYAPMLRLLSDEDLEFVAGNKKLLRRLRTRRRQIFRDYLRCLTKDYGRLLAGLRAAMVRSGVDRPDLARALARNQLLFVLAVSRIELRLQLHALGIGKVDVSGLVQAMEQLRLQLRFLEPAPLSVR
jgi:hypothetical protein